MTSTRSPCFDGLLDSRLRGNDVHQFEVCLLIANKLNSRVVLKGAASAWDVVQMSQALKACDV